MARKVILIHGYSDMGPSFDNWAAKLSARGIQADEINICNYISLNNEITIPDIAEGLGRAASFLNWAADQEFDCIVHSTGILVIRAWLANDPSRRKFLKHLVALAPATWGSPLAHLGRSFLGSIVRGNKMLGPDFLNSGTKVLKALELGSKFTWDLAHRDLLGDQPLFTNGPESPYVAVFIGNQAYGGIRKLIDKPGSDGTVRWSGCSLDTRKLIVDLRKAGVLETKAEMLPPSPDRQSVPMFPVAGKNHTSLLQEPENDLADIVTSFLKVSSAADYNAWFAKTKTWSDPAFAAMKHDNDGTFDGWQQFVVHVVDEYGDSVPDYAVDLYSQDPKGLDGAALSAIEVKSFDLDVHPYGDDNSFRCFHVRLPLNSANVSSLWARISASSGSELITYRGYAPSESNITEESPVILDLSHLMTGGKSIFHPFTTMLVEIRLTREPLPLQGLTQLMQISTFKPAK